jgi:hypothetical protein
LVVANSDDILTALMQNSSMVAEQDYEYNMQRVSDRTLELARLAGRAPQELRQADFEQAKREIASEVPTGAL